MHPATCNGELRQIVAVVVDAPLAATGKLSKKALRRRDIKIQGVSWDSATWYCPKCGWIQSLRKKP